MIYNRQNAAFSAQLIDFAVRHYIRIYQTQKKTLFKQAQYELEIIKYISDLRDEEREVLNDMFNNPSVGAKLNLQDMQNNRLQTYVKFSDNARKLNADIKEIYGLRAKNPAVSAKFKRLGPLR